MLQQHSFRHLLCCRSACILRKCSLLHRHASQALAYQAQSGLMYCEVPSGKLLLADKARCTLQEARSAAPHLRDWQIYGEECCTMVSC